YAVDVVDSEVGAEDDLLAQPRTGVVVGKIRERKRQVVHFRDLVQHRINRSGHLDPRIHPVRLVEDRQGVILKPKLFSTEIALIVNCKFVRPLQREIDFSGELNLHRGREHLIKQDLRMKAERVGGSEDLTGLSQEFIRYG